MASYWVNDRSGERQWKVETSGLAVGLYSSALKSDVGQVVKVLVTRKYSSLLDRQVFFIQPRDAEFF